MVIAAVQLAAFCGTAARVSAQCTAGWVPNGLPGTNGTVKALIVWDPDGDGPVSPQLVVAGHFTQLGSRSVNNIGAYDLETGQISNLGGGVSLPAPSGGPIVQSMAIGANNELIVAGNFWMAGTAVVNCIARWDGASWAGYGVGTPRLYAVAVLLDGNVVVGGTENALVGAVRYWNGAAWRDYGPRVGGIDAYSLCALRDGDVLAGGVGPGSIARGDGSAWYPLGGGVDSEFVWALAELSSGDVIVVGSFDHAGGVLVNGIARWDGTGWHSFGNGLRTVRTVTILRGGLILAGGGFSVASGYVGNYVALWDGVSWSALGSGTDGIVYASVMLPNGDAVVGGSFSLAGGTAAANVAQYALSRRRGDLNCDGFVNDFDIDAFVLALTDPATYLAVYPACDRQNADTNCDGAINNFDIDPFVLCLVGGGCS